MPTRSHWLRDCIRIVVLTGVYFGAGKLGLLLAATQENTTLVWPPTGIALAALLMCGFRVWPGIALGAFLVNSTTSATLPTVLAISMGNVLEALVGAYLLRRLVGFANRLERVRDVLGLVGIAAAGSSTISATIGVTALYLAGRVPVGQYEVVWLYWWLGDVMGALVVAPLLLVWGDRPAICWERRRIGEAVGLSAALLLVCQLAFGGWLDHGTVRPPLTFLGVPFLILAGLRFGPRGAATASFATITLAILGTVQGNGPFVVSTVEESLAYLHAFMAVVSVSALLLAAIQCERDQTQGDLRQTERRFRALIEHSYDAVALVDRHGTLLYSSPSAMRITGRAMDELIGQNGFARIHADDQRAARSLFAESLSTPGITHRSQFRYLHKNGSWIWVEVTATNLLHEPAVQSVVINYQDITEQRKSDEALRDSEARYRSLFERNVAGVFRSTLDGQVLDCNESFVRMFGFWSREELAARRADELYGAPGDRQRYVDELVKAGRLSAYEIRLRRADGSPIWALENVALIPGNGDSPAVIEGTITDISARKQAEESLARSERRLRAIIETGPACVKLVACDGTLLEMNPAGLRMIEADSLDQVVGRPLVQLVAPEDRERCQLLMEDVFRGESGQLEFEVIGLKGRRRRVETHAAPLRDITGEIEAMLAITRDVTDEKRLLDALLEADQKYRSIYENAVEGIFQTTVDGRFISANPALLRMYGCDSEEELKRTLTDIDRQLYVDPSRRAEFKRLIEQPDSLRGFTYEVYRKDGSIIWISVNARAIRDESGQVVAYEGMVQDITERKHAEQALRESEAKFRDLVQAIDGIVWEVELPSLRFTFVSQPAEAILGYPIEQWMTESDFWSNHLHPDDRQRARDCCFECTARGDDHEIDYRMIASNGAEVWLHDLVRVVKDDAGQVVKLRGVMIDVTERKQAEDTLIEERNLLRTLIDHIPDYIFIKDTQSRHLLNNAANVHLLGLQTEAEVVGKTVFDFYPPEQAQRYRDEDRRVMESGREQLNQEESLLDPDGQVRWLLSSKVPLRDAHGQITGLVGIKRDITDRKRAENELLASRLRLAALSRQLITIQENERRHLARELHDEIGQILSAVKINLESVKAVCDPAAGRRLDDSIGIVAQAIQQTRSMSLDLRPPMLDDFGLVPALRWYVDRQKQPTGCELNLVTRCPGTRLPTELESAAYRFVQEGLTNIVRHSSAARAEIDVEQDEHELTLIIRDDGVGFDVAAARERAVQGASFGLIGMQERVELLGGRFELTSAPGDGTTVLARFWLESPPPGEWNSRD